LRDVSGLIPPSPADFSTQTAWGDPLSPGDLMNLRDKGGGLRVIVHIEYGLLDKTPIYKYPLQVCQTFPVKANPDGSLYLGNGEPCSDSGSNYAE